MQTPYIVQDSEDGGGAILQHLHLLGGSKANVRMPITQPPPVMTQDMLAEKEAALSALGEPFFAPWKAARPGSVLSALAADVCSFVGSMLSICIL